MAKGFKLIEYLLRNVYIRIPFHLVLSSSRWCNDQKLLRTSTLSFRRGASTLNGSNNGYS